MTPPIRPHVNLELRNKWQTLQLGACEVCVAYDAMVLPVNLARSNSRSRQSWWDPSGPMAVVDASKRFHIGHIGIHVCVGAGPMVIACGLGRGGCGMIECACLMQQQSSVLS